jgi:RNA polymerase sigma factor for flagellar operon FliA
MKALVKKYKFGYLNVDRLLRDQLILDYAPLIRFIAQKISSRLPSNVDIDDLISAGVIGLMDAIEKYDPSRDNKFKTYAEFRVRGAILDELRSQDWVPRSVRDKAKKIERTYTELEQRLGRSATDTEISDALELSLDEYYAMISKVKAVTLLSAEDVLSPIRQERKGILDELEAGNSKNPFLQLKNKNVQQVIKDHIKELPEKQKLVLSLYYYEDLNLKEIGRILDVTESRVSQLHTQAVEKLRHKLKHILFD